MHIYSWHYVLTHSPNFIFSSPLLIESPIPLLVLISTTLPPSYPQHPAAEILCPTSHHTQYAPHHHFTIHTRRLLYTPSIPSQHLAHTTQHSVQKQPKTTHSKHSPNQRLAFSKLATILAPLPTTQNPLSFDRKNHAQQPDQQYRLCCLII